MEKDQISELIRREERDISTLSTVIVPTILHLSSGECAQCPDDPDEACPKT